MVLGFFIISLFPKYFYKIVREVNSPETPYAFCYFFSDLYNTFPDNLVKIHSLFKKEFTF